MIEPEYNIQLSAYEKLVRLTLQSVGGFTLLVVICFLPWRGLNQATLDPLSFGNQPGLTYLLMRVGLRAFPFIAITGLGLGWLLVALKRMRAAFYTAFIAGSAVLLVVASLVLYALLGGL
jgi:hypothetical protein